ncbi:TIGR00297 family protein [Halorutilales archaeon Cl-col2-1]
MRLPPKTRLYAVIGVLGLVSPYLGKLSLLPFALIGFAGFASRSPSWETQVTDDIMSLGFAAFGIALLSYFLGLTRIGVTASILGVVAGDFAVRSLGRKSVWSPVAFVTAGVGAGVWGVVVSPIRVSTSEAFFVVSVGVLVAATVGFGLSEGKRRLSRGNTSYMAVSSAAAVWVTHSLETEIAGTDLGVAFVVVTAFGVVSYYMGAASVTGALMGTVVGFVTSVVGGFGWLGVLMLFFVLGAASTRYRYNDKIDLGVAEENGGARGATNVLANSAVGLVAVVALGLDLGSPTAEISKLVFAGSLATATADTLSSEIGSVHETPRLITTFEKVPPGTDGGVTVQGEVVTVAASVLVAYFSSALGVVPVETAGFVVVGGVVGAHIDSVLGATVEGRLMDNTGVNFTAALGGGVGAAAPYIL